MNLDVIKMFASFAVVAFGVAACAADTQEPGDEDGIAQDGEEVASSEAEISGTSCKSDAYWRAHANRVCGGHANVDWSKAVRRYRRNHDWFNCQGGAVSVPFSCN